MLLLTAVVFFWSVNEICHDHFLLVEAIVVNRRTGCVTHTAPIELDGFFLIFNAIRVVLGLFFTRCVPLKVDHLLVVLH